MQVTKGLHLSFMKKIFIITVLNFIAIISFSQELFVLTEPASNMPSHSLGMRLTGTLMKETVERSNNFHLYPELMFALSKSLMIHTEAFISNRNQSLKFEGASLYMKYRFYSVDEIHSHFRMAAYARFAKNNSDIHQPAIDLNGHNSGYESGLVATKLIHKLALSTSVSYIHAYDNGSGNKFIVEKTGRDALGFTFSTGKLMLPKNYETYNQPNLNMMIEMLGQTNLLSGKTYLDAAPLLQLILMSQMRIDFGYRVAVSNALNRTAPNGFLLRLEYNFFNAF